MKHLTDIDVVSGNIFIIQFGWCCIYHDLNSFVCMGHLKASRR
jgi:hypothetical protein